MACLAAGGAILASERARHGMPAFAVVRPPGHHASRDSGWGYCYLCNIAVALKKLFAGGRISSAFVLDFDAHTGDGTRDCLADLAGVQVFNPMAETAGQYHREIESCLQTIKNADIIAVSAGFDAYVKDTGGKLDTFDFYRIGNALRLLCRRLGHNRRFAVLEGGYYHPDLGEECSGVLSGVRMTLPDFLPEFTAVEDSDGVFINFDELFLLQFAEISREGFAYCAQLPGQPGFAPPDDDGALYLSAAGRRAARRQVAREPSPE